MENQKSPAQNDSNADAHAQNSGVPVKPKLRGYSHLMASSAALVAATFLFLRASGFESKMASLIYGLSLVFLYTMSGVYHVPNWQPKVRLWLRRIDHSAIFLLIAGTFTPICIIALGPSSGSKLLWIVWIVALIGIIKSFVWINAPKWLVSLLCAGMGWISIPYMGELLEKLGTGKFVWLLSGGIVYLIGGLAYAIKRPNFYPRVFGYHEFFHAMVIAGSFCHFIVVYQLVL